MRDGLMYLIGYYEFKESIAMPNNVLVIIVPLAVIVLIVCAYVGSAVMLWLRAMFSGCRIGLISIVFMRLRRIPPKEIVEAKIMAVRAGIDLTTDELEAHCLAGGSVSRVVRELATAKKSGAPLSFNQAAAADLAFTLSSVSAPKRL
jgi:uncharacterized protein YqfA (UPF0365 family)